MALPPSIKELLNNYCGIDDEVIGNVPISIFIKNRSAELNLPSQDSYFNRLLSDNSELAIFANSLLVPETWFFRDTSPFLQLSSLIKKWSPSTTPLKILSLACATGEEPYSIAITLINAGWSPTHFSIYAVDLNQNSLKIAQKGIYSSKSFRSQDPFDPSLYFDKLDNSLFSIKEIYRKPIHFIHNNALNPLLFYNEAPFHILFARNILIYLTLDARQKLLTNIDRLLMPNGNLFLGHADHIYSLTNKFKSIGQPSAFAFEKTTTHTPKLNNLSFG